MMVVVVVEMENTDPVDCPIALNWVTNVHLDLQLVMVPDVVVSSVLPQRVAHLIGVAWLWLLEATIRNLMND